MDKLKIEYVDINSIKLYSKNAKRHPKKQIEQIKKSIEDFSFNDPIAIDENNIIIERTSADILLMISRRLVVQSVPITK